MARVYYPFGAFPFVVPHASGAQEIEIATVGELLGAPLGLSIDDAMRWYWRIRQWKLELSIVAAGTLPYYDGSTGTILTRNDSTTITASGLWHNAVADESQLVVRRSYDMEFDSDFMSAASGENTAGELDSADLSFDLFAISIASDQDPDHPYGDGGMYYDAGAAKFYPWLALAGTFALRNITDTGTPIDWFAFVIAGNGNPDVFAPEFSASFPLTLTIDGQSVTGATLSGVLLNGEGISGGATYGTITSCTASLTIIPNAYWPYANQAGQALYDTSSGAGA